MSTPSERSLRARRAALLRWSKENTKEGTAAARKAAEDRFYNATDPELPETERRAQAERARRAFFIDLALKSAQARKKSA